MTIPLYGYYTALGNCAVLSKSQYYYYHIEVMRHTCVTPLGSIVELLCIQVMFGVGYPSL